MNISFCCLQNKVTEMLRTGLALIEENTESSGKLL
jgi:hypothetical protein